LGWGGSLHLIFVREGVKRHWKGGNRELTTLVLKRRGPEKNRHGETQQTGERIIKGKSHW